MPSDSEAQSDLALRVSPSQDEVLAPCFNRLLGGDESLDETDWIYPTPSRVRFIPAVSGILVKP